MIKKHEKKYIHIRKDIWLTIFWSIIAYYVLFSVWAVISKYAGHIPFPEFGIWMIGLLIFTAGSFGLLFTIPYWIYKAINK